MSNEHFDTRRLNAIPITEVARRLGDNLKREGSLFKTHCPWHEDKHPSLALYERTGENHCYCFACGKGGSVIDYVMQHEQWTFLDACTWLSQTFGIISMPAGTYIPSPLPKPVVKAEQPVYTYIPKEMMEELVSAESSLCRCLMRMFQPEAVEWLVEEYRLGCYTMNGHEDCTVFPSIDVSGRVCNLKVQHYETDPSSQRFAHSTPRSTYWLGAIWRKEGRFPAKALFRSDCLFGEHLLSRYPSATVALVESPKNALFGALAFPRLTWVATGNKGGLKRQAMEPLRGRDIVVFPDRDAIDEWTTVLRTMPDLANITVSDFCRRHAPQEELKYDIADYLTLHLTG